MARYKEFWYNSWRSMMSRCYNKNAANFKYYGGAGITVCEEWQNAEAFGEWASTSGWFKGATLERIDNNKGYFPSNCRWATKKEQARNRSTTRLITHNGETHSLAEWTERLGVNRSLLINRLWRGWSEDEIFDGLKYHNQYERGAGNAFCSYGERRENEQA